MTASHPTRPHDTHNQIDTGAHRASAPESRGVSRPMGVGPSELDARHSLALGSNRIGSLPASAMGSPTGPSLFSGSHRPPVHIDAALDVCEQIIRTKASDRCQGVESLTAYRRRALCAIYAFAWRVHEIAHGNLLREQKFCLLGAACAGIPHEGTARPVDPVLVALRDTNRRFRLPLGALDDLVEGAERDVHARAYDTFEDLVRYCRQVGGSIARLSVAVLGSCDPVAAGRAADDLGVAIQLTTILRHLLEDFPRGHLYLPREDLARFECPADLASAPRQALARLIEYQVRRNYLWYDRGRLLLPLLHLPDASRIAEVIAAHEGILDRIERSDHFPLSAGVGSQVAAHS